VAQQSVRDTSAESHHTNQVSGLADSVSDKILNYLRGKQWVTRRQISEDTGISTATVSGLIKPMLDDGILLERSTKASCPITNRNAFFIRYNSGLRFQEKLL